MELKLNIKRKAEFEKWCKANKRRPKDYIRKMVKGRIDVMPSASVLERAIMENLVTVRTIEERLNG